MWKENKKNKRIVKSFNNWLMVVPENFNLKNEWEEELTKK